MQIRNFSVAAAGWVFLLLSNAAGAWSVNDDYDNQSVGERCGSFWDNPVLNTAVTSENSSSGSKSCKMEISEGTTGWGAGFVLPGFLHKGDESWTRFRIFMPAGFDYGVYGAGDTLKFVRHAVIDSDNKRSTLDWEIRREGNQNPYGLLLERDNCTSYSECWQFFGSGTDKPTRGTWETYEIYVKFDNVPLDEGGQGRVRVWKNGKLIGEMTRRRTMNNPNDFVKSTQFFSYWNGGAPRTQFLYFDDLVATNVRPAARDSKGNAYIGMGNFVAIAAPRPPSSIQ